MVAASKALVYSEKNISVDDEQVARTIGTAGKMAMILVDKSHEFVKGVWGERAVAKNPQVCAEITVTETLGLHAWQMEVELVRLEDRGRFTSLCNSLDRSNCGK